jgi:hypothetical protein
MNQIEDPETRPVEIRKTEPEKNKIPAKKI